jgi:hypothetical protein
MYTIIYATNVHLSRGKRENLECNKGLKPLVLFLLE